MFLKESVSGLRAVATAMSPASRTSWTRLAPKPVEVPVMRKTRGIVALGWGCEIDIYRGRRDKM